MSFQPDTKMLVRGIGIRDIAEIEKISIRKVLLVLANSRHSIRPKQAYYECLEVDEFWTYVGKKVTRYGLSMPTTGKQAKLWHLFGVNET